MLIVVVVKNASHWWNTKNVVENNIPIFMHVSICICIINFIIVSSIFLEFSRVCPRLRNVFLINLNLSYYWCRFLYYLLLRCSIAGNSLLYSFFLYFEFFLSHPLSNVRSLEFSIYIDCTSFLNKQGNWMKISQSCIQPSWCEEHLAVIVCDMSTSSIRDAEHAYAT